MKPLSPRLHYWSGTRRGNTVQCLEAYFAERRAPEAESKLTRHAVLETANDHELMQQVKIFRGHTSFNSFIL